MANILPPPPINDDPGSFTWLEWYRQLRNYVSTSGSVPWYIIDFTGSTITDIASRQHNQMQSLQGGTAGEYYHLTAAQLAGLGGGSHNDLSGIQGGTTGQYYHLTQAANDTWVAFLNGGTPGYGWSDVLGSINAAKVTGASQPTWSAFQGGIYAYSFSATSINECWITLHIGHDYKPGSAVYPHIHWSTIGTNTGVVRWGIEYSVAKGHQQGAFPTTTTIYLEQAATGTARTHMITEVSLAQAITTNIEPDSLVMMRIFRDGSNANDTCTDAAFALFADIHYQSDRTNTRNKAPNFYI